MLLGTKLSFDYCLQILATKSPNKFYVEESESDTSDSSDDLPLASALTTLQRKAVMPPPSSFPDINDEVEDSSMGQLITNAMNTVNNMTNASYNAFLLLYFEISLFQAIGQWGQLKKRAGNELERSLGFHLSLTWLVACPLF